MTDRLQRRTVWLEDTVDFDRVTIEPDKMGGVPCIRGLRMPVVTVARMVQEGMSVSEILEAHPDLEPEDIEQAVRWDDQ